MNIEVSDKLLNSLAHDFIKKYDISSYVYYIANKNCNCLGLYNPNCRCVYLNKERINKKIQSFTEYYNPKISEFVYTKILYHELAHAYQEHNLNDKSTASFINQLLIDSSSVKKKDISQYYMFHDLFPKEHNADALSIIELLNTSEYHDFGVPMSFLAIKILLKNYKLGDTKVVSPTEQFYTTFKLGDIPVPHLNTYTSLLYGLPISVDAYKTLTNIIDNKEEVQDVKTLIRTL